MSGRVYQGDNEDLRVGGKLGRRAERAGAVDLDQTVREANELMDRFQEEVADAKPFDLPGFNRHMDEVKKTLDHHGEMISKLSIQTPDDTDNEQYEIDFTEAMAAVIDKFQDEPAEQAELHWGYLRGVLQAHGIHSSLADICGHHYKTAFVHGWKHGQEALNGKV